MTQAAVPGGTSAGDQARKTLLAGAFIGVWAVVGWVAIRGNPQIAGVDFGSDPGPGLLPAIVLTILSLGAAVLVVSGLAGLRQSRLTQTGPTPVNWRSELRDLVGPVLLCLALAAYLPLVRLIGFVPGTLLFSVAVMAGQRVPQLRTDLRREGVQILIGALVCLALTWGLFIYWIGVALG